MNSLADKAQTLIPFLKEQGSLFLLALFERDDVLDKWDLVVSSDWSDKGNAAAIKELSMRLVPLLSASDLTHLSRIVVIPSAERAVHAMTSGIAVESGQIDIRDCNFMGLQINHAIVLSSKRPSSSANYPQIESAAHAAVNPT